MGDTLIALRHRIKNTGDLRSVTRTMKAMSAASIVPFEEAAKAIGDYRKNIELALSLCLKPSGEISKVITRGLPMGFLVFGTDQGMVGQFNEQLATDLVSRGGSHPVIWTVGERVRARLENAKLSVTHAFPTPGSVEAITILITDILLELEAARMSGKADEITVIHNRPVSAGSYEEVSFGLLPLDGEWQMEVSVTPWPTKLLPEFIHPSPGDAASLIHEYLFSSLFQACAESCAAEHAARLAAMQLAEKNIEDRQQALHLDFNRQRQKVIDEELFDLITGFEALTSQSTSHSRT